MTPGTRDEILRGRSVSWVIRTMSSGKSNSSSGLSETHTSYMLGKREKAPLPLDVFLLSLGLLVVARVGTVGEGPVGGH